MPRVLATEEPAPVMQHFDHITVTDRGSGERNIHLGQCVLQRQIGHQRTDNAPDPTVARPTPDNCVEQLVAIIELPPGVNHLKAIGIAIERHAEVGAMREDGFAKRFRRGRSESVIDVQAIGPRTDLDNFGTQFMKDIRRRLVSRAVRAIDDNLEAAQIEVVGKSALAEFDVASARIVYAPGPAEIGCRHADHRLIDALLDRDVRRRRAACFPAPRRT